ncbi:MAG: hypothetical protein ACRDL7_10345, partial [Gaiellaceae bacterium]
MRLLTHPATVIAAAVLVLALGGGAAAYASGLISGSQIKNHSIAAKKLTKGAIKSLRGRRGPAGAKGATGPRGPGGQIVTYDAKASASPTKTTLGTFLGDTISASCSIPSTGQAQLNVFLQTPSGAWHVDYSTVADTNGNTLADAANAEAPAGTYSPAKRVDTLKAKAGGSESDTQFNIVQTVPSPGSMVWHE